MAAVDDLYWLDQIQPLDRDRVGDKAFYLALLKQRNYPVAPGFVIPTRALQDFLAQVNWQEYLFSDLHNASLYVDTNNPRQLQTVAQQIQQAILTTALPEGWLARLEAAISAWQAVIFRPSVALRSGLDPTVSSRAIGLLASQISNPRSQNWQLGLKRVWAEFFGAKSLFYWQRFGIQIPQVQLALLVQPIQSSIAAGTVKIQGTQVEVEATWGLGHSLELGGVDQFRYDMQTQLQSEHLGQKLYTYRLEGDDELDHELDSLPEHHARHDRLAPLQSALTTWVPDFQTGLQLQLTPLNYQTQAALTPAQLQVLIQLAQQIQTEFGMPFILEWTLNSSLLDSAQGIAPNIAEPSFLIHQVIPQFESARTIRRSIERPAERLTNHLQAKLQPESQSESHRTAYTNNHVLKGLAAAPGRTVAPALVLNSTADLATVPNGVILVAATLTPALIQLRQIVEIKGIVTEQGGLTSHAAILARELGIPAAVGVTDAMQAIQTGDPVALDGDQGYVYYGLNLPANWLQSGSPSLHLAQTQASRHSPPRTDFIRQDHPPIHPTAAQKQATTHPPTRPHPHLWLSLSQPDYLSQLAALPVDGIGLLRSELMLLDQFGQQSPEVWFRQNSAAEIIAQIAARLQQFAAAFAPRPVFYRALDLKAHEFNPGEFLDAEASPAVASILGVRGTFGIQLNSALFQAELLALRQLQQQGVDNLSLLLPFVRTVEEFSFCRQQVEQAGLFQDPQFQLWIMAEVPSVLLLLPDYQAAGVQGIAIGVNDLTQLLLGADRDQPHMATAFDSFHPAVLRAIQQLVQTARQLNLPCSLCGQRFEQRPELLANLVEWGVTAISVEPREAEQVSQILRQLDRLLEDE